MAVVSLLEIGEGSWSVSLLLVVTPLFDWYEQAFGFTFSCWSCCWRLVMVDATWYKMESYDCLIISDAQCMCNTYTTGTSALPEIYTQAQGSQARGHVRIFRQSTSACGISNMYHNAYGG